MTDERCWSYHEIAQRSQLVAQGLAAQGVRAGQHVGLILANGVAFVVAKFAVARIGAVAVPINYLLRRDELAYILAQSDCVALITMDRFRDCDYLADLDAISPGWESRGGATMLPRLKHIFVDQMGADVRPGSRCFWALEQGEQPATGSGAEVRGDDVSDIVYTSGTTGRPKGVLLTHQMVLRTAYASAFTRAFQDGRRILFALPMYHVFGYVECLLACLFAGGAVIPMLAFDAEKMIVAAERHEANEIVCVPMMTQKIIELSRTRPIRLPALRAVFNSGGASPVTLWDDIRTVFDVREILTAYGMTETTASTTCTLPEGPDLALATTNGRLKQAGAAGERALGGVLAVYRAVDPATGAALPNGQTGELVVRGPSVTSGYYNKPEETAAAIDAQGWFHTGDLGCVSAEGFVTLSGRLKDSYRCGGETVMPQEIEALLADVSGASVYLVGVPDAKMGEVGCICAVIADERPDPRPWLALCAERFARFKVPRHVIFVRSEHVPMTATGRVQRALLAQLASQHIASGAAFSDE